MDIHRVKRDRLRGQPQVLRELLASCQVDQGNAPDWVEAALADGVPSAATMVYHSVVWQYLWTVDRARFERVMAVAGEAATHNKPLAWLRFEPAGDVAEVRLQLWPGSKDRLLAQSGFHGKPVQWLGSEN